ncbi:membrane anchoring protein efr3a [Saguinus oedipus]|uniref:Membrane anchoring protein efr3a n=1 Tax=Saguinus oedipus TaxID=9490 RepID=A0ABQ9UD38_SAGOE|nr:membrane anchoring protein efr3a [Saguinus oedipus]
MKSCFHSALKTSRIRIAGIRGIQGVVRKTVNDELRATIWEPQHMDKIVPSLLFNMQKIEEVDSRIGPPSSPSATDKEENPAVLAENCFRELLGRATFGNMNNAVRPVFAIKWLELPFEKVNQTGLYRTNLSQGQYVSRHLDHHKLWDPNEFAVHCFKIIMYSIQKNVKAQYSHHVIQEILGHLDARKKDAPRVRAGIIQVLLEAVAIAAKGSIGPTVLEVFNTLLKHLRLSVEFEADDLQGGSVGSASFNTNSKDNDEKIVQNAIIQTIGFFGSNLPDYQRSEIMMFIMGKVPVFGTSTHTLDISQLGDLGTRRIQIMLLRSLLMVTSGYKAKTIVTALPGSFLDPLLSPSLMEDYELRQLVLEVMHNLMDRHDNRAKLRGIRIIPDVADLKIKREKICRQDTSFMKKGHLIYGVCLKNSSKCWTFEGYHFTYNFLVEHILPEITAATTESTIEFINGQQLYRHIYLGCKEEDNVQKNYELLYTSLALITIELANEEVVIDLIRLAIALQDSAIINEDNLPMFHRCGIMALVAAYLNFVSQMIAVPAFCQHVSKSKKQTHPLIKHLSKYLMPITKEINITRADYLFAHSSLEEPDHTSGLTPSTQVAKVIEIRTMEAPYFLPEHIFRDKCMLPKSLEKHEKDLYFLTNKIAESLGGSGYSVERLSVPYVPQVTEVPVASVNACSSYLSIKRAPQCASCCASKSRNEQDGEEDDKEGRLMMCFQKADIPQHARRLENGHLRNKRPTVKSTQSFASRRGETIIVDNEDRLSRRKSIVDTVSIQVDILSNNVPSDDVADGFVSNTEEITFEALKKAIDTSGMEEQEKEKRRLVIEKFQKAPFEEIAAQCESKANLLHDRLAQILELTIRPPPSPSGTLTITSGHAQYQSVPVYEMKFPDLCVY